MADIVIKVTPVTEKLRDRAVRSNLMYSGLSVLYGDRIWMYGLRILVEGSSYII